MSDDRGPVFDSSTPPFASPRHSSSAYASGYGSSPPKSEKQGQAFDPWLLWVTARRCWTWAVPLGGILAAAAAYVVFAQFVPEFKATHTLEVNQDHVVFKDVLPTGVLARTERQWITNPLVLDPVLADPRVRAALTLQDPESAEGNLQKNLEVSDGGTKSLLLISYTDPDREAAAEVCNAIVDSYLRLRRTIDDRRVADLESWIAPSIEDWTNEMENHQARIRQISRQLFGHAPDERVAALEQDLSGLQGLRRTLADKRVEQELLRAELERKKVVDAAWESALVPIPDDPPPVEYEPTMPSERAIAEFVNQDTAVRDVQTRIQRTKATLLGMEEQRIDRLRQDTYRSLQEKLTELEQELEDAKEATRETAIEELQKLAGQVFQEESWERHRRRIADRQAEIVSRGENRQEMQQRLLQLDSEIDVLQQEFEDEKRRLERSSDSSVDLLFAKEDMAVASEVLSKLKSRVAAIRTERRRGDALTTVAPAKPPRRPVAEAPWKKIFVVSGGAFLLPFLLGLGWEFRTQRVTDSQKVQDQLMVPVVGEVSRLPNGARSGRSQRIFEESIDSLRANIFLSRHTANARSIAICSSMSGEGKSSVASQLAVSIAKATGETVLLVDADLRSPDQHDIFGLEMGPGLSKVLKGDVELEDAINKSLGDLVHVLPAGRLTDSPQRLLGPAGMRDLLDSALETYRYVVVDTAPVLAAGESLAIAASVDVTLLCVLRDVSRIENIGRTTRRLEAAGATLAGTVFSGVPVRQYAYRYGDYHYAAALEG